MSTFLIFISSAALIGALYWLGYRAGRDKQKLGGLGVVLDQNRKAKDISNAIVGADSVERKRLRDKWTR